MVKQKKKRTEWRDTSKAARTFAKRNSIKRKDQVKFNPNRVEEADV